METVRPASGVMIQIGPGPRGDLVGCSEPRRRTFAGIGDAAGEPGRSVVATVARRILVVRIVIVVIVIGRGRARGWCRCRGECAWRRRGRREARQRWW